MSVVKSADIPDEAVVKIAVSMSGCPHPTTDLCGEIMRKFGCSANVAGKVYSRVVERQLVRQGKYDVKGQVRWYWEET